MLTDRLELRRPVEADRARMVELWCDPAFTVFAHGDHTVESANRRFDRLVEVAAELSFAKQPIIERSSGEIIGYAGADRFEFEGRQELELGWRLGTAARGKGYATEAATAILDLARRDATGWIYCIIDPANAPSHNVARKVGFEPWRRVDLGGPADLLRLDLTPPTG